MKGFDWRQVDGIVKRIERMHRTRGFKFEYYINKYHLCLDIKACRGGREYGIERKISVKRESHEIYEEIRGMICELEDTYHRRQDET